MAGFILMFAFSFSLVNLVDWFVVFLTRLFYQTSL